MVNGPGPRTLSRTNAEHPCRQSTGVLKMIADNQFKSFAAIGQTVLPESGAIGPELLTAISQARKASMDLSDKLFILENLLEEVEEI